MRSIVVAAAVLAALAASPRHLIMQAPVSSAQRTAIIDSVTRVTDSVFAAGSRRDLDRMLSLYAADATLLHNGKPENWKEHNARARASYKTLRAADFHALAHQIDVLAPTVAVWHGQYAYRLTDTNGRVTAGTAATTWVLTRQPQGWRIAHIHISDPPPLAK